VKLVRAASLLVHSLIGASGGGSSRVPARPGRSARAPLARPVFVRVAGATAVMLLAAVLLPAGSAQADPTRAEAEKAVDALTDKMEIATEQYNDARADLEASKARVAKLEPKSKQLNAQLAVHQAALSRIAASAYSGDNPGMFGSIVTGGSARDFLDRASYLDAITSRQRANMEDFLASKKQFDDAKAKVDAELLAQAKNEKTLRDKRAAINKDLAKWQALSARFDNTGGDDGGGDFDPGTYTGPASGRAKVAIAYALAQAKAHRMYEWGAAGPMTFDCSGLTMAAWARAGVHMPHTARGQYRMFPKVSLDNLRPGDLVMYGSPIHHVAMYIGNGMIVHASTHGKPVMVRPLRYGGSAIAGAVRPG
jgi:cell wall-associated NlpC family hydrolase